MEVRVCCCDREGAAPHDEDSDPGGLLLCAPCELVPRPQLELGRVEVAVDEHTGSGVCTSEVGRRGEGPVADGLGDAFTSVGVAAPGFFDCGLVTDESADVVEGGGVGDAGEDDLGSVVVDHGLGEGAVAGLDLGEVLPDGDELDADHLGRWRRSERGRGEGRCWRPRR